MNILAEEVTRQGAKVSMVYTGPLRRPYQALLAISRMKKSTRGFDIIHAQYGSGCGYVASKLPGPKLISIRGSDWYGLPSTNLRYRLRGIVARWLTRTAMTRYDAVLTMSERMKCSMQDELKGLTKIEVLTDGIDLDQFQPLDRIEARRRLGKTGDSSPWVLFCTWEKDSPLKRPWLAEATYKVLKNRIPDARLMTVTGKSHDEIPLWLNASDVVLLTSTHEGWPNIIKEALSCNVPFVGTDVSDLRAIANVEPNCYVAEASPEALANCLASALSHGRTSTLRRHAMKMDIKENARRLIQIYCELMSSKINNPGKA